jgi:hypothetical protein
MKSALNPTVLVPETSLSIGLVCLAMMGYIRFENPGRFCLASPLADHRPVIAGASQPMTLIAKPKLGLQWLEHSEKIKIR